MDGYARATISPFPLQDTHGSTDGIWMGFIDNIIIYVHVSDSEACILSMTSYYLLCYCILQR